MSSDLGSSAYRTQVPPFPLSLGQVLALKAGSFNYCSLAAFQQSAFVAMNAALVNKEFPSVNLGEQVGLLAARKAYH